MMLNVDLSRVSVAGQPILPNETVILSAAELEALFKCLIRVTGRMTLPATLHLGIGRHSEIGTLMASLTRYPGQVVLYGTPDAALPPHHLRLAEVRDDAPLSRERFLLLYSSSWQTLAVATPGSEAFHCLLTQDSAVLHQTATLLGAAQDRAAAHESQHALTAQLLWNIAAAFPDIDPLVQGIGGLGAPLSLASSLCQRGEWQAAVEGLARLLSASSAGLFRLDVGANALAPIITMKPQRMYSLGHDTPLTRAALTREIAFGEEMRSHIAAFPLVNGDHLWGAVEVKRDSAWDDAARNGLALMAEVFRIALHEQNGNLTALPPVSLPAPTTVKPAQDTTIDLWPEFEGDAPESKRTDPLSAQEQQADAGLFSKIWPDIPQLESLFPPDPPADSFEEVLDVFSLIDSEHPNPETTNGTPRDEDLFTTWPSLEQNNLPGARWPDLNLAGQITSWPDLSSFAGQVVDMRSTSETPQAERAVYASDTEEWPTVDNAWGDDYHDLEQAIRAARPAESGKRTLLEAQLAAEHQLIIDLQRQVVAAQTARAEFEQLLNDQQSTRAQLEQMMSQEQEVALEIESHIAAEQKRRQSLISLLADAEYQRIKIERQLTDKEALAAQHQAALAQARAVTEGLESALAVEQNARQELEQELAREQGLSAQVEAQLTAQQAVRASLTVQFDQEAELRRHLEQALAETRAACADMEAQLAHEQQTARQLAAQAARERALRQRAEQALERERAARAEAEYAAVAEIAANDGLQAGSFLRDLRLYITRMRERVSRFTQSGAAPARLADQVVTESNTVIDILSDIALIAQIDVGKHIVPDLGALLQEALASLYQSAAQRQVVLQLAQVEPNLGVSGDHEALLRALYNVILSGVHMSVPQSTLIIALARREDAADIRVTFHSTGELASKLESFMHHFDQGVPRRSALALARTIVMHHRGALTTRVTDNGATTEITISLPLSG